MKIGTLTITCAVLISSLTVAQPRVAAQAEHTKFADHSTFDLVFDNPCTGETVSGTLTLLSISQTTVLDEGANGIHQVLHFVFHGAAVGQTTGDRYVVKNSFVQVFEDAGDPNASNQSHLTTIERLRFINTSGGADALLNTTFLITDNGMGIRVLAVVTDSVMCQ